MSSNSDFDDTASLHDLYQACIPPGSNVLARSTINCQADHRLSAWHCCHQMLLVLQCLSRCREEVCEALNLKQEDVELSMGMSGDFEEAVSHFCSYTCHVAASTLWGRWIGLIGGWGVWRQDGEVRKAKLILSSVDLLEVCNPALPNEKTGRSTGQPNQSDQWWQGHSSRDSSLAYCS